VIADDLNSAQEMKKFLTSIEDVQKKTSLKFLENMTDASKKNAELKRHHDIMEMRNALSSSQKKKPNKPDSLAQTAIDWWVELPIKWTKCN